MFPDNLSLKEKYTHPVYDSFEKAISSPRVEKRNALAKLYNKEINGSTMLSYAYNGCQVAFLLSINKVLEFSLSPAMVTWKLYDPPVKQRPDVELPEIIFLKFPFNYHKKWRWKRILDALKGRKIKAIAPSDVPVWFYPVGGPHIYFSGYKIANTNQDLLFFDIDLNECDISQQWGDLKKN